MMEYSFFGNNIPSGEIRAVQVATRMNANLNPENGYEDDICIYVKQMPELPLPKNSYVDVLDWSKLTPWFQDHPKIGIIAFTKTSQEYLSNKLGRSDIKYIPQHHCNFERSRHISNGVKTVGFIGGRWSFIYDFSEATELFRKIGLNFIYKIHPKTREDVVKFYNGIDIQVCYRPKSRGSVSFKDSLKIANAGSFGIPTVTFPEPNNVLDFDGCFVPARTMDEVVEQCKRLKGDKEYYDRISKNALLKSEDYHIDNIIKLYHVLEN